MTTKTKTDGNTKGLCHYDSLTRTKFFHGMLLTDEHLRAEQTYHREALKRLNRHLWGAGIVCGLEVKRTNGLCVKVSPGFALDCDGNAIEVCKGVTIDLSDLCKKAFPDGCAPEDDGEITKYLVLRYGEITADPQQVLTPDDDCTPAGEGTKCEASKYREGFCLEFRDECPDCAPCRDKEKDGSLGLVPFLVRFSKHRDEDLQKQYEAYKRDCMASPPCRECDCEDCAVGLAKLVIDCANRTVKVECDDCRQYVWSPRLIQWLLCQLLANINTLDKDEIGIEAELPPVSTLIRNPLYTVSNLSDIALDAGGMKTLQREVYDLNTRLAAVEKTYTAKGKKQEP